MLALEFHDKLFEGYASAARGDIPQEPNYISFDRRHKHDIALFTDDSIHEVDTSDAKINLAWLVESPDYKKNIYKLMLKKKVYSKFDRIYTFDRELLRRDPRFRMLPFGGSWIRDKDWKIYDKDLNLSIIASRKKELKGHKMRHSIVKKYHAELDGIFGSGYQPFEDKLSVMQRFRYSIVVENGRKDYYFTEKLLDCFAVGTVPIYWGCPSIGDFFDVNGIISFKNIHDLRRILNSISEDDYYARMEAIHDNLNRAKKYVMPEDNLFRLMQQDELFASKFREEG